MANDDEFIMSNFKNFVSTRSSFITYYEMDEVQISAFNSNIMNVSRNLNPNAFPDFIGEILDVEVFNVTSSKETSKGAQFSKDKTALEKRLEEALKLSNNPEERTKGKSFIETLEYKDHSHDFWISSLQRNIKNHKDSRLKYSYNGKEIAFLAHYTQKVLSYKDADGVEQWHRLGADRKALSIINSELHNLINYFILFNETNSEAEVFPIKVIPSYLKSHTLQYDFYPREDAGMICIGISDSFDPIQIH